MQGKPQSPAVCHYKNLLLFVELCAPQIPEVAADSKGGNPRCFTQNTASNAAFPFLPPFSLWLAPGSLIHCSLSLRLNKHSAEFPAWGQGSLEGMGHTKELELKLPWDKKAILEDTKFDKISFISRLLMQFHQRFVRWQILMLVLVWGGYREKVF